MKEAFEKIIGRLEEEKKEYSELVTVHFRQRNGRLAYVYKEKELAINDAIEIVNQVAEEFGSDINVGSKDGWIPYNEKTPEFEIYTLTPVWVTIRKKDGTFCWVTLLRWNGYAGRLEWNNGKAISDTYEVLAWKKVNYPAPYQPKGEQ